MAHALGQDARPFALDRASAQSALNAVAIIEAHVEEARTVMEAWPGPARAAGLAEAVVAYKDQFARLKDAYSRVRRAAAETLLDGQPRDILVADWDMLKVLDDVTATLAFKAGDVAQAQAGDRALVRVRPLSASTIAAEYAAGPGLGAGEIAVLAASALLAVGVTWAVARA